MKTMGAAEFQAQCLQAIRQVSKDREPVTITRFGRPVAILSPPPQAGEGSSIIGAMRGSVIAYEDPLGPATDPADWHAVR